MKPSVAAPHEHEFEPEHGLPEPLPEGERVLWQGAPQWRLMARRVFHVRKLALYFGIILVVRAATVLSGGGSAADALSSALWLVPPVGLALGMVVLMAWLSSRTSVYTITDRRVVMRVGIVLSLTFNLPLSRIAAAGLRAYPDGSGDIPLTLRAGEKIAFIHLWPHARPWRLARPEPMLRSLTDAVAVASLLAKAWADATGESLAPKASVVEPALAPAPPATPERSRPSAPAGGGLLAAR